MSNRENKQSKINIKKVFVVCTTCDSDDYRQIGQSPDFEYFSSADEYRIVECRQCGTIYINPRPVDSELTVIYPPEYIPYQFNRHLGSLMAKLRDLVQKQKVKVIAKYAKKDDLVVDVGCGGGGLLYLVKKYGDPSWRLQGIDISESVLTNVRQMKIGALTGRFEIMDLPKNQADIIIMNQVIEHLDNPAAVIVKSYEYLKLGGYLIIETPSTVSWDAKLFIRRYWGGWHIPRHWYLFNQNNLSVLLEKNGFQVVEKSYLLSPNFWVQSIHHYLIDKGYSKKLTNFFDCNNFLLVAFFSLVDLIQIKLVGRSSNMRLVAKKK